MGAFGRGLTVLLGLVLIGLAIYLAPRITSGKHERSAAEKRQEAAAAKAERARRIVDQAVHTARTTHHTLAGATAALQTAIGTDLRARQRAGTLELPRVRR